MRRPLGMKATFILALVGFSAVMAAALATVSAYRVKIDLLEQLEQRGQNLVTDLAHEAIRILRIEDSLERELSLMLLTHRLIGDVVYAQVVHNGEVVSESKLYSAIVLDNPLDVAEITPVRQRIVDAHPTLEFVQILPGDSKTSYVRLGLSLEQVRDRVRRNVVNMAVLAVLFTLVGAALAFALYSATLKPLERVIASIRRFQAGDLGARAHVASYPELRELGEAFNRMAEVIGRRNEELQRVNAELQRASDAKSQFLAMIGHELKTPLHTLRGYCQVLLEELDGPLTPEQRADIEIVLASGNHLLSLIDNILHFSASGSELLHVTPVALDELIHQAANYVKPLVQQKGLYLHIDAQECGVVDADETKLKQIVINLLHNAVKHTDQGGVTVEACCNEEGFSICVRDTGPGIPPGERTRIFEPFERVEGEGAVEPKGLGLGLAIVQRYVTSHGGRIIVGDAPGGGASFVLTFPAAVPRQRSVPSEDAASRGQATTQERLQGRAVG